MESVVLVVSTFPSEEVAAGVARTLVEERLVACVNLVPKVRSIYVWDGKVSDEIEVLAIAKTTRERRAALVERLAVLHPYEVPEIIALDGEASPAYATWVRSMT